MPTPVRFVFGLFLLLGSFACGSSNPSAADDDSTEPSRNRLVVSDLSAPVGGLTAYDLVRQHRPQWLRTPGTYSLKHVVRVQVYIDNPGGEAGSVPSLKQIRAINISSIEYFPPNKAQFRFGMGNSGGVILVNTKDGS